MRPSPTWLEVRRACPSRWSAGVRYPLLCVDMIEQIRTGEYVPSPGPALVTSGKSTSLAETASRVANGVELLPAVREFLDHAGRLTREELTQRIRDRPPSTGSREGDALLGGIAEHFAAVRQLPCPAWTRDPERFLDRFWFVSAVPGFRAISLAQTPMALKRRGVFWPARSLERV